MRLMYAMVMIVLLREESHPLQSFLDIRCAEMSSKCNFLILLAMRLATGQYPSTPSPLCDEARGKKVY